MAVEVVTVDGTTATPYLLPPVVLTALQTVLASLTSPTFAGTVTLPATAPTAATQAASKSYVDAQVAAGVASGGGYRDLGAGNAFPTTGPGGTPLQLNDAFDYAP